MKKRIPFLLTIVMVLAICFSVTACGGSQSTDVSDDTSVQQTEPTETEDVVAIKKKISDVDDDLGSFVALGVDSIELTEDGALIIEFDGALEESLGEEVVVATGVRDVFLLPFGNGGFRTIAFIREDGTVSALNTSELLYNKNIEVMDNLGGYQDAYTLEGVQLPDAIGVNVVMNNGESYSLDPYLK